MASQTMASSTTGFQRAAFGKITVPTTPSKTINKILNEKCNRDFDSKPKILLAQIVCGLFKLITMVYEQIYKDKTPPNPKLWMASCGIVGLVICLLTFLVYSIVIGSAFMLHSLLYYGCIGLAVAGVGLCAAGAFYFDKDPAFQQGFESNKEQ